MALADQWEEVPVSSLLKGSAPPLDASVFRVSPDVQRQRDKVVANLEAKEVAPNFGGAIKTGVVIPGGGGENLQASKDEMLRELSIKALSPSARRQVEREYESTFGEPPPSAPANRGSKIAAELKSKKADEWVPVSMDQYLGRPTEAAKPVEKKEPGVLQSAGAGIVHGLAGLAESVNIGLQFIGNRVGSESAAARGESGAEYWGGQAKPYEAHESIQGAIADNPGLLAKGSWWAYNLADMIPSLAASIIPGVGAAKAITVAGKAIPLTEAVIQRLAIAGGSVIGGAAGGSLEGAQTYQEVLKRGAPEGEAAVAGSTMALASAALNAISVGKMVSPSKASALVRFLTTGATEGLTEWMEEPAEGAILSRTSVAKPEDDPATRAIQGLNVLPIAAVMGGGAGLMQGRPPEAAQPAPAAPPAAGQPTPAAPAPPAAGPTPPPAAPYRQTTNVFESKEAAEAEAAKLPGARVVPADEFKYPGMWQIAVDRPGEPPGGPPGGGGAPMSAIDQARADAQILKSGGDLGDELRTRNATLVSVYGENAAVRHVVEGGDQFSAIADAMLMAAPTVERVRGTIQQGEQGRDITPDILDAIDELAKIKESGQSVADVLAHGVPHDISWEGQQLLQFLDENATNPKKIAAFLESYLHEVEMASGVPSQVRGRAFDIIQEREAAKKAEAEKEQAAKKDEAFAKSEKTAKREKAVTAEKATVQHAAEKVLQTLAAAKASGSGINPEHQTAMEAAFANAKKLKGKSNGDSGRTGKPVQGSPPSGTQAGPGQVQTGNGKGPVSGAVKAGDKGNARPVRKDEPAKSVAADENRGRVIAAERSGAANRKAEVGQAVRNRILADANLFGDSANANAAKSHGFDSLDRNAQHVVLSKVVSALDDEKVLRSIVESIPVDVMNMLVGGERSAEDLLHDKSVLAHRLSVARDVPVGKLVTRFIDALASKVGGISAQLTAEKSGLPDSGTPVSAEGSPAVGASELPAHIKTFEHGDENVAVNIKPTEAQKEAGNYLKGAIRVGGLDVSIENPAGSKRKPEWPTLAAHYGYVRGVLARSPDKEHVDVFVKPGTAEDYNGPVFVIDQNKTDGTFDESKSMVGFKSEKEARAAYLKNYSKGFESRIRGITEMTMGQFKAKLQDAEAFMSPQKQTAEIRVADIPKSLTITLPVTVEEAGESVLVEMNARKAFRDTDKRVNRLRSLRDCLRG
jgi:hypothetical protein